MTTLRQHLWLCVAPLALYLVDIAITLLGQPATYWAGDHASVVEGNPVARAVMRIGPGTFALALLAWGVAFTLVLAFWRHPLAVVLAFVVTFAHAVCAGTWFLQAGPVLGPVLAIGLLVASERLLDWTWRRAGLTGRRLEGA